jgi:ssDNA-binding Zn-finger/Zn-ribbon topoisomerase 1
MRQGRFTKWLLLAAVALAAISGVTMLAGSGQLRTAAQLLFGASLLAIAVVTIGSFLRRSTVALEGYRCPECAYTPKLSDIKKTPPHPCPRCGQPVYRNP